MRRRIGRNQGRLPEGRDIKICRILGRRRKESTPGGSSTMCKGIRREGHGRTETRVAA